MQDLILSGDRRELYLLLIRKVLYYINHYERRSVDVSELIFP